MSDFEKVEQPTPDEMTVILEAERRTRTRKEQIDMWRSAMSSAWWRPLCERMREEEQARDQRLRACDGKDPAYENRLRGAADAFTYIQAFMLREIEAFDQEQAEAQDEEVIDAAARHYAEYGRHSPFPVPDNPVSGGR